MTNTLVVMAKRPQPGHTKTRLCPPLSPEQAARIYEGFLRDTLALMREQEQVRRVIAYLPETEQDYFSALAPDFELVPQVGHSLGARLDAAFRHCFDRGAARVVIVDSDSPTLPAAYLSQAFEALAAADVVMGPCHDGGYYLIGLKRPAPHIVRDVKMSTPHVLRDTLALAEAGGLQVALLPAWYDVDTLAELDRLKEELVTLNQSRAAHTREFFAASHLLLQDTDG